MLVVHHLSVSQSERIVWLCEELGLDYELVRHIRDPAAAPDSLKSAPGNRMGKAPFIQDTDAGITLGETAAICEYIIQKFGKGKLGRRPEDQDYHEYLYWFHFATATLQTNMMCSIFVDMTQAPATNQVKELSDQRTFLAIQVLDDRLKESKYAAGDEFTAADIMIVYNLTTQRYWGPLISLKPYENVMRYVKDCTSRPAHQKALSKSDPEMKPLIGTEPPSTSLMYAGGVKSDIWKA